MTRICAILRNQTIRICYDRDCKRNVIVIGLWWHDECYKYLYIPFPARARRN